MGLKIAVLRALKLGDMLCSLPALHALRLLYPNAELSFICHPSQVPLLQRYQNIIDVLIPFAGYPGMPEQVIDAKKTIDFICEIQKRSFDIVFQMQGSGQISNPLVSLFGAKKIYGHYRKDEFCPDPETFTLYPENVSEVHRCLNLLKLVSQREFSSSASFPLYKNDFTELYSQIMIPHGPYVCLHPGASTESKRWSKRGFARVADYLKQQGYEVVFTGSKMETNLVAEIQSLMSEKAIDSASLDLPLGPLAALISQSKGLVCNDTGVSHLAALLKLPSLVIFSETDPARWAPLDGLLHRALFRPSPEEVILEMKKSLLKKNLELIKLELT